MASANRHRFSRASSHLPSSYASIKLGRDQSDPLVPPYPNILYPLIKIVLVPLVPLSPLRSIDPIYGVLPISLVPLGPLPHPVNFRGMSEYLSLNICKGGPIRPCLDMLPFQVLHHIVNILSDNSYGLFPDVELSLTLLSHNPICLVYLFYE